jgi:hypothetical protein
MEDELAEAGALAPFLLGAAPPTPQRPNGALVEPVVATDGKRSQIAQAQKRRGQAKTVAMDCDQSLESFHGKEGVDGSSPSEGFKEPANQLLLLSVLIAASTSL